MRIEILDEARDDLAAGFHFYQKQSPGVGSYFLDSLFAEIDALLLYGGMHRVISGANRCVAQRFPVAIYYRVEEDAVRVLAILEYRHKRLWKRVRGRIGVVK